MKGVKIEEFEFVEGKQFYYSDKDGETRDLIILGKGTENYSVIGWGKWVVRVAKADTLDLSKVEDILVPSDLTILSALLSSSAGDYVLSRLSEKVEDETTLTAARGTIKTLDAVLDFSDTVVFSFIKNERGKAICEFARDLKKKIERNNDITWGDIVVLDVITNICTRTPQEIIEFLKECDERRNNSEEEKEEEEPENLTDMFNKLIDRMYDFLFESVELLNRVSGTTGVFRGTSITKLISACFMK